jgi:hypothetical protein
MTLDQLKQILELGYPAIITVAFVILAAWYRQDTKDQIEYLRKENADLEARCKAIKPE